MGIRRSMSLEPREFGTQRSMRQRGAVSQIRGSMSLRGAASWTRGFQRKDASQTRRSTSPERGCI